MRSSDIFPKQSEPNIKMLVQKPEIARPTGLAVFRLPFTAKRSDETVISTHQPTISKTPRQKTKVSLTLDLQSPLKLENPHKTLATGFGLNLSTRANSFRPLIDNTHEPKTTKNENLPSAKTRKLMNSEVIMIRAPPINVKSSNSPTSQKPFMRVPISDLYKDPEPRIKKSFALNHFEGSQTSESPKSSKNEFDDFSPLGKLEKFEENKQDSSPRGNAIMATLCSTMESSTHFHKTKLSFNNLNITSSPAAKSKNIDSTKTLKDLGLHLLQSPKGDNTSTYRKRIKVGQLSSGDNAVTTKNQHSKAINKFTDAFEKAKVYNDQVILQYQFDKQNEEEERDFCELYEMLKSNIGE